MLYRNGIQKHLSFLEYEGATFRIIPLSSVDDINDNITFGAFDSNEFYYENVQRAERGYQEDPYQQINFPRVKQETAKNILVIPNESPLVKQYDPYLPRYPVLQNSESFRASARSVDDNYIHGETALEHPLPDLSSPISYSYNYHVEDPHDDGPHYSKHENSDGQVTNGEYSVKLPDGRTQTVSYSVVGDGGFSVKVRYV